MKELSDLPGSLPPEWRRAFSWLEAKLGGRIVRAERQARWRPAGFLDLERGGETGPPYFRRGRGGGALRRGSDVLAGRPHDAGREPGGVRGDDRLAAGRRLRGPPGRDGLQPDLLHFSRWREQRVGGRNRRRCIGDRHRGGQPFGQLQSGAPAAVADLGGDFIRAELRARCEGHLDRARLSRQPGEGHAAEDQTVRIVMKIPVVLRPMSPGTDSNPRTVPLSSGGVGYVYISCIMHDHVLVTLLFYLE